MKNSWVISPEAGGVANVFASGNRADFLEDFDSLDIFVCSPDLKDKFFDIKECSLVPAVKDGFISGKVGEKFFVAAAVVESISDLIGVDGSGSFEFCRFRHGFDGFVKLESMIVRMVLMETIVINGLFYGMAVEAAAEVNLTEKFLYKLKRSTKGKADFIDEFAASGVEGWRRLPENQSRTVISVIFTWIAASFCWRYAVFSSTSSLEPVYPHRCIKVVSPVWKETKFAEFCKY